MRVYLIADNQEITREGIRSLVTKNEPEAVIVPVGTVRELLDRLKIYPDSVVITDYALMDFQSEQQLVHIMAGAPESSWLLFFDELSEHFLRFLLVSAPTVSTISKHAGLQAIVDAVAAVRNRECYICDVAEDILQKGIPAQQPPDLLTASEKSVLHEIALGKTTKEIANEKFLSFHTINTHRRNIFRKLQVNNAQEAVRYAVKVGILDLTEYYI
ncbi:MAG: response regulator transcription factor [Rikenellaceae bacterium]|nr:response regulator transcription factor [Rikenellaceae bacterium]